MSPVCCCEKEECPIPLGRKVEGWQRANDVDFMDEVELDNAQVRSKGTLY